MLLPGPFYLAFSPEGFPFRLRPRKPGLPNAKLPLFSRYWTATELIRSPYYGFTSNGRIPAQARPPILSKDGLLQYQKLPGRFLLPWRIFPRHGTIAADTNFYPFGTCMYIPGYGWGEVEDTGGAITGPDKIDLFHSSHAEALRWGRRKLQVKIMYPGEGHIESLRVPEPAKGLLKGLAWMYSLLF